MNIVWKGKKGQSGKNRMILIHSNVSKFFLKSNTLTRCIVLQTVVV